MATPNQSANPPPLEAMISPDSLVGGIFRMGFEEALVLTNDDWKARVGGVPQHCFLLATAMVPGQTSFPDDQELVLLRVQERADIPEERDLLDLRARTMREMIEGNEGSYPLSATDIIDVFTRNEIQFAGLRCKVLGSFYMNDAGALDFASDLDNYFSVSRYLVYKPSGDALGNVVGMLKPPPGDPPPVPIPIGRVRYSSAERSWQQEAQAESSVDVPINLNDIVAMKTALFGMTRLGKSNTLKILATAIAERAGKTGQKVGQLLFDPTGEYSDDNVQGAALYNVGTDLCVRYRLEATSDEQKGIKSLALDFFDEQQFPVVWTILTDHVLGGQSAGYKTTFASAEVDLEDWEGSPINQQIRVRRRRMALYAVLIDAGFQAPLRKRFSFKVKAEVVESINNQLDLDDEQFETDDKSRLHLNPNQLVSFFKVAYRLKQANNKELVEWVDADLEGIAAMLDRKGKTGSALFAPLRGLHRAGVEGDYAHEILNSLKEGKIVLVDLSRGSEVLHQTLAERVVRHILSDAIDRFNQPEKEEHLIQIYIEEAHTLFDRTDSEMRASRDPYVRLAKEAAKYKIGLVYATQEVTSVHNQILANTSNWIVTHLNNRKEVKALGQYYDFGDFEHQILTCEDVGFARVKTRSGRFIIPTQIDKFDMDNVNRAKQAHEQANQPEKTGEA